MNVRSVLLVAAGAPEDTALHEPLGFPGQGLPGSIGENTAASQPLRASTTRWSRPRGRLCCLRTPRTVRLGGQLSASGAQAGAGGTSCRDPPWPSRVFCVLFSMAVLENFRKYF